MKHSDSQKAELLENWVKGYLTEYVNFPADTTTFTFNLPESEVSGETQYSNDLCAVLELSIAQIDPRNLEYVKAEVSGSTIVVHTSLE